MVRAIAPAAIERAAARIGGGKDLETVIDLDTKVLPEISGARNESRGGAGWRAAWIGDQSAIGIGEIDLDGDLDGLFFAVVVEERLLRAVVTNIVAGELCELREWGEKSDGRDVRAGFGQWEKLDVIGKERCIVTLAEEIGFADGFVGEGRLERERSGRNQ